LTPICLRHTSCTGNAKEILESLSAFGIAREDLPVSKYGDMLLDNHREWIRKRQLFEFWMASNSKASLVRAPSSASETERVGFQPHGVKDFGRSSWSEWEDSSLVITPSKTDVLIAHRDRAQFHQGNLRLKVLLENYLKFYTESPAPTRGHIVVTVIGVVKSYGGRFLIHIEGGLWQVADSSLEQRTVIEEFQTTTMGSANQLIVAAATLEATSGLIETPEDSVADPTHVPFRTTRDNHDDGKESSSGQGSVEDSQPSTNYTSESKHGFDSDDDSDDGYAESQEELPAHLRNDFLEKFHSLTDNFDACQLEQTQDEHGVRADGSASAEEDPEMVQESLKLMDMEIERRKAKYGGAYVLAESTNAGFVKDRNLRMMCLRYCNFNGKDAALQLFDFFEAKLDLFGPDKIAERITLSNMGAGARGALENGHMQMLPSKDLTGHRVIFNNVNRLGGYEDGDDVVRLAIYIGYLLVGYVLTLRFMFFLLWHSSCV
jgi:hypothetical protein